MCKVFWALPFTPAYAPAGSSLKQSTGLFLYVRPWPALSALSLVSQRKKPKDAAAIANALTGYLVMIDEPAINYRI